MFGIEPVERKPVCADCSWSENWWSRQVPMWEILVIRKVIRDWRSNYWVKEVVVGDWQVRLGSWTIAFSSRIRLRICTCKWPVQKVELQQVTASSIFRRDETISIYSGNLVQLIAWDWFFLGRAVRVSLRSVTGRGHLGWAAELRKQACFFFLETRTDH